jgi:hypothetical protein
MTAPVTGGAVTVGCFEWVAHLGVATLLIKKNSLFNLCSPKVFKHSVSAVNQSSMLYFLACQLHLASDFTCFFSILILNYSKTKT